MKLGLAAAAALLLWWIAGRAAAAGKSLAQYVADLPGRAYDASLSGLQGAFGVPAGDYGPWYAGEANNAEVLAVRPGLTRDIGALERYLVGLDFSPSATQSARLAGWSHEEILQAYLRTH